MWTIVWTRWTAHMYSIYYNIILGNGFVFSVILHFKRTEHLNYVDSESKLMS